MTRGRGFVIIARARESILLGNMNDEYEVVSRLFKEDVIEILPYEEFAQKYAKK